MNTTSLWWTLIAMDIIRIASQFCERIHFCLCDCALLHHSWHIFDSTRYRLNDISSGQQWPKPAAQQHFERFLRRLWLDFEVEYSAIFDMLQLSSDWQRKKLSNVCQLNPTVVVRQCNFPQFSTTDALAKMILLQLRPQQRLFGDTQALEKKMNNLSRTEHR